MIIVTSRPVSSGDIREFVSSRIEIVGFTASSRIKYFRTCLKSEEANKILQTVEDNPLIESICYLPLNAAIVVYLFCACNLTLPSTYYELFQSLVYHCIKRHIEKSNLNIKLTKHQQPSFDDFPEEIKEQFEQICKLAYCATKQNMATFSYDTLCSLGVTNPNRLGLMQSVKSFVTHGEETTYHFLHLSLQELLAAYHISKMTPDAQVKVFKKLLHNPRFTSVFGFYAGFTKFRNKGIQNVLAQIVQTEKRKSADKTLLVSLMNWLYEAQEPNLCQFVWKELTEDQSGKLNGEKEVLNLSHTSLTQAETVLSVGYFVSVVGTASGKPFCADLSNCSLEDRHAKFLVKGLSHFQTTTNMASIEMNLSFNRIHNDGIYFISNFLQKSGVIQKLKLKRNKLSCSNAYVRLFDALVVNTSLTELDISQCSLQLGEEAGESLKSMLTNNHSLVSLDISYSTVSPECVECIADGLKQNHGIKTLHMTYCNLTAEGIRQISEAIQQTRLEKLSIGPLRDDCMKPLGNALISNLQSLSLRGEKVTDEGLQKFGKALPNSLLLELSLQDFHSVTSEGLKRLGEQLQKNQTIKVLAITRFIGSSITDGLKILIMCFKENTTLEVLKLSQDKVAEVKETVCSLNKKRTLPLKLESANY